MNEETKKAIDDSIEHWKRMIKWAEKKHPDIWVLPERMSFEINEAWDANNCALCSLYYSFFDGLERETCCKGCPIASKSIRCEVKGSTWSKVARSKTWGEWTKNAKEFLKILEGLKDEKL